MPVIVSVIPATVAPVVAAITTAIMPVIPAIIAPVARMPLAIARRVHVPVPVIPYEIHRPSAGVVPAAVAFPVTRVAGRDDQIDRRRIPVAALDDHRLAVDEPRPAIVAVSDIQLSVEAGLAHADRNAHVGNRGSGRGRGNRQRECNKKLLHGPVSFNTDPDSKGPWKQTARGHLNVSGTSPVRRRSDYFAVAGFLSSVTRLFFA